MLSKDLRERISRLQRQQSVDADSECSALSNIAYRFDSRTT